MNDLEVRNKALELLRETTKVLSSCTHTRRVEALIEESQKFLRLWAIPGDPCAEAKADAESE